MNRNTEIHFSKLPQINMPRSKFDESFSLSTTFNNGQLVPLFTDSDITPGDTVKLDMAGIIRLATQIYPVFGNCMIDLYAYFVPHRLVWEHWEEFWGQNDDEYIQQIQYEIPQIEAPSGGWATNTIADYMGIPTYISDISVNALPFRAYCKIWNDFYRDENLQKAIHIYKDETTRTGTNNGDFILNTELGALCANVAKLHDYFTSCLPEPQKGPAVTLPLGEKAPVYAGKEDFYEVGDKLEDIARYGAISYGGNPYPTMIATPSAYQENHRYEAFSAPNGSGLSNGITATDVTSQGTAHYTHPMNLYTDLGNATAATVSELRSAFALQKFYEAQNRFGSRYIETILGIFGTSSSDARLQRAEYLGGCRIPVNMSQIIQTSSTDTTSPQGNTAGFSCTQFKNHIFTKSFEEHGTLMILGCTRVLHSYQQGLHKMWSRKKMEDFYNPFFANLSEQAVLNKEIYCQGDSVVDTDGKIIDDQVFGYQERFAEYRYKENMVTGSMRSNTPGGGLDAWHWADDYNALPTLGNTWIQEPKDNIDRTIAVTSERANQFKADFYFDLKYTRVMPVYGIPGLIDHV